MSQVMVVKQNGEKEPYSEDKIKSSASRVGVPDNLQNKMISAIRAKLYDGIPTQDIITIIKSFLTTSNSPYLASKYNLKKSLSELGPSGYPFEKYIAKLLFIKGYQVKINQILAGSCVSHEVDVLATKNTITYPIEAKFHSGEHQRTDIRVALYIWARYEDLNNNWKSVNQLKPWIVTNTRFSKDAERYARCKDIKVTSWGFPRGEGIMDLIEETSLHPITILETLTPSEKKFLISSDVLTCLDLREERNKALLPAGKRDRVIEEAEGILSAHHKR